MALNENTNHSSTSSSSPRYRWTHDVFLSFRGKDTRNNFVSHLHAALVVQKLKVFKDDKSIRMGRIIWSSLFKAIEESRISIVVFSKNYGDSFACLEELVKIMKSRRSMGLIVIPMFYHVEPTEIRRQSGCFGEGFAVHGNHINLAAWRSALTEAADIAGLNVNGNESECITKIVETVLGELGPRRLVLGSLLPKTAGHWCLLSFRKFNGRMGTNNACTKIHDKLYESVHVGKLDKRVVDIKKIHVPPLSESDSEFSNRVSICSRMKHENIAKIYGYCIKDTHRFLVEEHASNGMLHQILHGVRSSQREGFVLALSQRVAIAYDIAKGLDYLHAQNQLGHVGSSNVLLFINFKAKISPMTSEIRTYRAPECDEGELTKKGDVYSFGVLLRELLTGREPFEGIRESVTPTLTMKNFKSCIDPKLNGRYALREATKLARAILSCTADQPSTRPDMRTIVDYLKEVAENKNKTFEDT